MKLVTQRDLIRDVAQRFRLTFNELLDRPAWRIDRTVRQIAENLDALDGEMAIASDVDTIIGNIAWTTYGCINCGQQVPDAIDIETIFDDLAPVYLCFACVDEAATLVRAKTPVGDTT